MPDYLLRIVARDQAAFQKLYDARLATLPGIERLTTTLVMKHERAGEALRFEASSAESISVLPARRLNEHPLRIVTRRWPYL
jgi:DNA-binding Lrp family transcriptional regulator